MLPCCWRNIAGKTYFEHRNIPLRLTSRIESHCCSDRSRTLPIPRTTRVVHKNVNPPITLERNGCKVLGALGTRHIGRYGHCLPGP